MIIYVVGDLFESSAKVLVNAVNTVGVMGAGNAAEFKRFYPAMFDEYAALCREGRLTLGSLWLYRTAHKWVLNFPIHEHFRSPVQLDALESGLQKFIAIYADQGITSIAFPMLGVGHGRLDWEREIRPLMEAYLNPLPIAVYIHRNDITPPFHGAARGSTRGVRAWLEGQPKQLEFSTLWRDLNRIVKQKQEFTTLVDNARFRVGVDNSRKALVLLTGAPQPVFLSQTMLNDLWLYVRSAGYVLPHNLPNGLDVHAPFVFALLAKLDYLRPTYLGTKDGEWLIGLHYVPPVNRDPARKAILRDAELLPDVLAPGLKIVFCGTAASAASTALNAYYAGPGNRFWETLYRVGLTPRQFVPEEFRELLNYGIGLTDLAKLAGGGDSAIPRDCFDAEGLLARVEEHAPEIVAFTSKRAAQEYYGSGVNVEYGWQRQGVGGAKAFVLPSPSGAARGYWDESYWQQLAAAIKRT